MISIQIDNKEVSVGADFSFDITRCNPFFVEGGDYTYEVELSLEHKDNARLYVGFNRPNCKNLPTGRNVVIRDGSHIIVSGKEILLEKTEKTVKIQIVANESQFNLESSNKKLRDLNLPNPRVPNENNDEDKEYYKSIINGCYPEFEFALPLVFKGDPGWGWNSGKNDFNSYPYKPGANIPQPYLLWVIDKVVECMGYAIGYNYLSSVEKYKRLCVVNLVLVENMGLRLPDWTVGEFILEVEKFFGVVFMLNSSTGLIDIVKADDFYSEKSTLEMPDSLVHDEFVLEPEKSQISFASQYQNVRYDAGSSEFWNLADMDDELYNICRKEVKRYEAPNGKVDENDLVVFKDNGLNLEWIYYKSAITSDKAWCCLVNQFRKYKVEETDSSETLLKIVPAVIRPALYDTSDNAVRFGVTPSLVLESLGTLSEQINGQSVATSGVMEVAYSLRAKGRTWNDQVDTFGDSYPHCTNCKDYYYFGVIYHTADDAFRNGGLLVGQSYDDYTLALCGDKGRVKNELHNKIEVDTSKKYTFFFAIQEWLSPKSIFHIRGRRYLCAELRYKITNSNLSGIVEGDFYPMK